MKFKLRLNQNTESQVREELLRQGNEITEDAELIVTEEGYCEGALRCRDASDTVLVPLEAIVHIESFGKEVLVYTSEAHYQSGQRLYQLEALLPSEQFLRISNSVIIRRSAIVRVRPALSCRFTLKLTDGAVVDVTRTYYYKFKEFFGI